jgi:hypothetical protein
MHVRMYYLLLYIHSNKKGTAAGVFSNLLSSLYSFRNHNPLNLSKRYYDMSSHSQPISLEHIVFAVERTVLYCRKLLGKTQSIGLES